MITIDFETKSYAELPKVGAWAYSEDPTTDIICACWGIDDEPIESWWPYKHETNDMPKDLYMALMIGHEVEAHNLSFEKAIWRNVLMRKYGWRIEPHSHQWRDTMAVACYYAMPAKLDKLARACGFKGKDPEGDRLITKYSKLYLKTAKTEIPEKDFKKFVAYCERDVLLEQNVSDYLGGLPDRELPIFLLDQEINTRGLYLDKEGIEAAANIVDQRAEALTEEFIDLTGYKPTQGKRVLEWFESEGLELENLQAAYLEELMEEGELPSGNTRRALEIRLQINKASTKKLDSMLRQRGSNGRARYQTRYHGAVTGRSTGSGFQPLNLNRGFEDPPEPEQLIRDIKYGDARYLDLLYGDATDAVAKASRHFIQAEEGNKIIAGDFVSIEAIVLACLAGEQWKIDAFKRGDKIYELMGDKIHGYEPGTVTKATHPTERFDGKTGELAFGYQGALGAWRKFDRSDRYSDKRVIEICRAWRREHPEIVSFWYDLENVAIECVDQRKFTVVRNVGFEIVDEWLSMILPNDKRIWYFKPEIRMAWPNWHKPKIHEDCASGKCDHKMKPQLTYMAVKTGQWKRISTYGGKLAENATQATSREILECSKRRVANAWDEDLRSIGFLELDESSIILSVYDEVIAETPQDYSSSETFKQLMLQKETWYEDYPISVDVWEGRRYKK